MTVAWGELSAHWLPHRLADRLNVVPDRGARVSAAERQTLLLVSADGTDAFSLHTRTVQKHSFIHSHWSMCRCVSPDRAWVKIK